MTNLFSPYSLGSMTLANRVVMAPMTRNMSPENIPSDDVVEYYRRRAEGGVGLIITEGTCVGHKAASGYPNVPFVAGEKPLAGWKKVIDAVHAEGGKIPGKVTGHAMTQADIDEATDAFVQAAVDSEKLGFDAIELHGAHGYLLDQFFWEGTNERDDQYGGSVENRVRFACDIVRGIRAKVSADYT